MADSCGWCGRPRPAGRGRRWCSHGCRQAAYRARRRADAALRARVVLLEICEELRIAVLALERVVTEGAEQRVPSPGAHARAAREIGELTEELTRVAVLADRAAGAQWARIGAGVGLSAEAARARYGHWRLHPEIWPSLQR